MTATTQDPARPHVTWYTPDPQAARMAKLELALYRIRTLAGDAPTLATVADPAMILETIYKIAGAALAGAEPCATVEAVVI